MGLQKKIPHSEAYQLGRRGGGVGNEVVQGKVLGK
jgi:hypothetical protein